MYKHIYIYTCTPIPQKNIEDIFFKGILAAPPPKLPPQE